MKKTYLLVLFMCSTLFVFAEKVATFPDLLRVGQPLIGENFIYLKEGVTIYMHSLPDFKLMNKFGREGEGPREFKRAIYWWGIRGDSLVVQSLGRMSYFTVDGKYKKEVKLVPLNVFFIPVGERFVGMRNFIEKGVLYYRFRLFDENQDQLKVVLSYKNHYQRNKSVNPILDDDWPFFDTHDNKIFIENQDADGVIDVFDYNGDKLFSIGTDLDKIEVTAEDQKRYIHYYATLPGNQSYYEENRKYFQFPTYFPLVHIFRLDNKKVYVLTHEKGDQDERHNIYIYDMAGKRLGVKTAVLQHRDDINLYPFTIKAGKLYQMIENPDTDTWELHLSALEKK